MNGRSVPPFQVGRYRLDTDYRVEHYIDTEIIEIERHYHVFYECIFFYSGDVIYYIGNHSYRLVPGDVLLINAAQIHMPKMLSADPPYDRISLLLDQNFAASLSDEQTDLTKLFESQNGRIVHLQERSRWEAKTLLSKIVNLRDTSRTYGQRLLSRCYITELLVCLGRAHPVSAVYERRLSSDKRIPHVKEYIAKHLSEELSLDRIAQEFHISKYHLSHEFKKQTGMSLYAYIVKNRLITANTLLREGCSVKETYSKCGYSDISLFNRAFKQEFGMSPKQYYDKLHKTY